MHERAERIINGEKPGTGGGCRNLRDYALAFPRGKSPHRTGEEGWATEPRLDRVVDGVANGLDRLKAIGNGQVPSVVALAWKMLSK